MPQNLDGLISPSALVGSHPAVLDRALGDSVERIYGEVLDVLRELINEGTQLQVRIHKTGKRDIPDMIVAGTMFNRFLRLLDTVEVLLRVGQVYGARIIIRALVEASWAIEWVLKEDTSRRARQFYVADLHERIEANEEFVPGTRAYRERVRDVSDQRVTELGLPPNASEMAKGEIARIKKHIQANPELRAIEQAISSRKGGQFRWFQLFGGPNDFRALANRLGRGDEYRFWYRHHSQAVHGSWVQDHVSINGQLARVRPIRSLVEFEKVADTTWIVALRVIRLVLTHYRPGELDVFRQRFAPSGKSRWNMPQVEHWEQAEIID